jgi:speckle-type POZ protein
MSMSALLSALRGAGRRQISASTIGVRQVTGSHVLRIDGYTQVRKMVPNGENVKSGLFRVGGHDWRLMCYPNGNTDEYMGFISLFLQHASHGRTGDATANVKLGILPDVDVTSDPTHSKTTSHHRFTEEGGLSWGYFDFIKHEVIGTEKMHLKDDCLTILCDVTVSEPSTADHIEDPMPEDKATEPRTCYVSNLVSRSDRD